MQAARAHPGTPANKVIDTPALQVAWQAFNTVAHLRPIHSEADYDRMVALMNALLDVAGDDEHHPLSGLLELAAELVSRYEQEHHAIEAANPKDALRFLMEARGLSKKTSLPLFPRAICQRFWRANERSAPRWRENWVRSLVSVRLCSCRNERSFRVDLVFWRSVTKRTGWLSWRMRWKRIGLTDPYCPPFIFTV